MLKNVLIFFCSAGLIWAQAQEGTDYRRHFRSGIVKVGEYHPPAISRTFAPTLHPLEMPYPHPGKEHNQWEQRHTERAKKAFSAQGNAQLGQAPAPLILDTLEGNRFTNSVPNDDDFAISRDGIMLSVRNSNMRAYDLKRDSLLFETTFFLFLRDARITLNGSKYDPRVLYDPEEDRFVVVFLNGNTWQSSVILTLFSMTANPADGFHIYQLEGNPLQNNTWSDYPHITLTKTDMLITMNTFFNGSTNNSGYVESTIRTLNKQAGYRGEELSQQYFSDITFRQQPLFNFTGMAGGSGLSGLPYYFLSTQNLSSGSDTLFLITISDSTRGNPELSIKVFRTEVPYGLPPDARQKNNHRFDCNDARVLDGFIENNRIQFVGNTNTSGGNSGIYHGVLDPDQDGPRVYFKIIRTDTLDFGYPNITYTGKSPVEVESILTFNHCGPRTNSGFSALFFDNDTSYSLPQIVMPGRNYADVISGANNDQEYERWGDYTGAQRSYADTGVVFASGYNTSADNFNLTGIAQLRSPRYRDAPILPSDTVNPLSQVRFGPNPAREYFGITFFSDTAEMIEFTLYSLGGQAYRQLFSTEQPAFAGNNNFTFNTKGLGNGLYYLVARQRNGAVVLEEKILISKP